MNKTRETPNATALEKAVKADESQEE